MTKQTTMTTSEDDHAALELAILRILGNPEHAHHDQIKAKLESEPWADVARFAAYSEQIAALCLKPWHSPPASIDDPEAVLALGKAHPDYKAAKLLQRMLQHGVSKFHPDPLRAIDAASDSGR
ncbi:hypothetical protein P0R31_30515 [Bradyrhizobium yuanmingense]|uniref:hypothetical protein n=1 Tax=Bradyrhizobium yuanmingense TaxID=108015 RepID=UPI0023B9E74E|nr:hypothetical protein [Bradyrhizobium yuanmingense]MDF0521583.1 hypothetical protein [Bradyrhizobium yuanmingense]